MTRTDVAWAPQDEDAPLPPEILAILDSPVCTECGRDWEAHATTCPLYMTPEEHERMIARSMLFIQAKIAESLDWSPRKDTP